MPVRWLKARPERLAGEVSRFGTRDFLHAAVAGCALVAAADGIILPVEKQKMQDLVRGNGALSAFDPQDVAEAFLAIAGRLESDYAGGRAEVLRIVGRLRGDPAAGRLCMRVCCTIAAADGLFDEAETQAVAEIAEALGLPPELFDI